MSASTVKPVLPSRSPAVFVAFDIETGPLPVEEIERIAPKFSDEKLKFGNLGLEKRIEKINAEREKHLDKILDKAALNAQYGQVLAIGIRKDNVSDILLGEEDEIIADFWTRALEDFRAGGHFWIGHNSNTFDLPFLLRRSIILGVNYPRGLTPLHRYWPDFWVDLMEVWRMGDFAPKSRIQLDTFAKACGIPGKNGSGKFFSQLLEEDKDAAVAYLENDLDITYQLAARVMGCRMEVRP